MGKCGVASFVEGGEVGTDAIVDSIINVGSPRFAIGILLIS